jgi:alpha-beta hydrolase superfamily lysophospholipase
MEFTLKNCIKMIEQALAQHCLKNHVSAVGSSLGALVLIEYLGSHESAFKKIILISCCFKLKSILDAISPIESRVEEARKVALHANRDSLKTSVFLSVL